MHKYVNLNLSLTGQPDKNRINEKKSEQNYKPTDQQNKPETNANE